MSEVTSIASKQKVERDAKLKWVAIAAMSVSPIAQRELNESRVNKLVSHFDLEQIGTPTVNLRDDTYFIVDGQHRIEALRSIGWGDQQIQCWTYIGLSESEEAEKFLKLNDYLAVTAFTRFAVAVQAGRPEETDIDRIVRANGMRVAISTGDACIAAVGTLKRVYEQGGPAVLSRTLNLIGNSFGPDGLNSLVIGGVALVVQRYGSDLNVAEATKKLSGIRSGASGLLGKAELLRRATSAKKVHCVAAATVEILNSGRGGKKLPSWWAEA